MTGNRISMLRSEDFKQVVDLRLCAYGTNDIGQVDGDIFIYFRIISCSSISARTRFTLQGCVRFLSALISLNLEDNRIEQQAAALASQTIEIPKNSQDPPEGILKSNRPLPKRGKQPLWLPGYVRRRRIRRREFAGNSEPARNRLTTLGSSLQKLVKLELLALNSNRLRTLGKGADPGQSTTSPLGR
ncbi:hypothetical protein CEXT_251331 [Caerostris extrusa]|uniref:Uncharacterized protein n=1 Tax=Caerostris extrusa TaxID=172846 RepID=A0AAV4QC65_CAEEX|nr:hypothetical protein CEXT_251331 [Caerostris extrusa]